MQTLRDRLVATIAPLDLPAYQDDPYLVHMTLIYGQQAAGLEHDKQMIGEMDFGPGFQESGASAGACG